MKLGEIRLGEKYKDVPTGIVGIAICTIINWHGPDVVTLEWRNGMSEIVQEDFPVERVTTYSG